MDDTKQALVTTTETVVKEGNSAMVEKEVKSKENFVEEAITTPISGKKKLYTVNKTDKSQASNKTVDIPKTNKSDNPSEKVRK